MLRRLSIAFAGATLITLTLIYGMSTIAEFFDRPDSQVYLRVMDFIPGSGERRRPSVRKPAAQPARASVEQNLGTESEIETSPDFNELQPEVAPNLNLDIDAEGAR